MMYAPPMKAQATMATAVLAVCFGVATSACGRSAESEVGCPAPAASCPDLAEQQAAAEAAHAGAAADASGAAVRREAGECVAALVAEAVVGQCVDACDELCRLHPCPVKGADGAVDVDADCAARCAEVIADNAEQADNVRAGNEKAIGWFVGQVMKASQGKANPGQVNQLLKQKLLG